MSGVLYISRISSFVQLVLGSRVLQASCRVEAMGAAGGAPDVVPGVKGASMTVEKALHVEDSLDTDRIDCLGMSEVAIV